MLFRLVLGGGYESRTRDLSMPWTRDPTSPIPHYFCITKITKITKTAKFYACAGDAEFWMVLPPRIELRTPPYHGDVIPFNYGSIIVKLYYISAI